MSVCFKHCRFCAVTDCALRINDDVVCDHYEQRPQTRADSIRAMSDEELAEFLDVNYCPPGRFMGDYDCKSFKGCRSCWLDWLRKEADG